MDWLSVDQVAEAPGLHVRTVRGYIRDGRLRAQRIGKQYRISRADLDAFTGVAAQPGSTVDVTTIMQVEDIDRGNADRVTTAVIAVAGQGLRVQTVFDEKRGRLRVMAFGDPGACAELLRIVEAVVRG